MPAKCQPQMTSNRQQEAISRLAHLKSVTHFDRSEGWEFDFLRGLSPGRLRESFGHFLPSLKAERCDFLGKNRSGAGAVQKLASTLVLLLRGTVNSELEIFKIAKYIAAEEANSESITFNIKLQTVTQTDCAGSL